MFVFSTDNRINMIYESVPMSLGVFGAVWLLCLPKLCSLLAGLGLRIMWRRSWRFLHVALRTIKRDLM